VRSELFNVEQMEQHGLRLAQSHVPSSARQPEQLLARLAENEEVLVTTRELCLACLKQDRHITPAGEWLLDNFYLVEEQIRTARRHLPKGYSRELPRLMNGPSAGLPRVYDIALETISHGDGRLDPESLRRFLASYQTVTTLRLGELWAIPIMLRLALLENLRRVAERIASDRTDRNTADDWADKMAEASERDPNGVLLVTADMVRSDPPMVSSFVAELSRRLQGRSPALAMPLTWVEQRLSKDGLTINQLVQSENQQQAADQVSISNSIGSLRLLGAMNWRNFVEELSIVEQIFTTDIGGIYGKMDFATRDRYRHVAERIAKTSPLSEDDAARMAIRLARESANVKGSDDRSAHIGFYLIDKGLPRFEREAGVRRPVSKILRELSGRIPLMLYASAIFLIAAILTVCLFATLETTNTPDWLLVLTGVLTFFCASQFAVTLTNCLSTMLVRPHPLPKMDFSTGIPVESSTLVVVPTMLASSEGLASLVESLEVRFLANRGDNLRFGLLTDFADSLEAVSPQDQALLELARQSIEGINKRYPSSDGDLFFLFHRSRIWNSRDKKWMGYERKRGKLGALNCLLRDRGADQFALVVGDIQTLQGVKYVITLDTDTQLPRDAARECIGTMAHPLNRARYDQHKQLVTEGYGILQPRVAPSLPGANRSLYARMCGGEAGIDPYTRTVSDVYQDVFGEGSFIGKGIYDVDAFEQSLTGQFPENRILSHDLLEGCYARAGLLSDVQVYETDPSFYVADVKRRHRWIRGDWQIARWLFPLVPASDGGSRKNPLSALSRWKIFDNLRRSLTPLAMILLLLLSWSLLPRPWLWTLAVIAVIAFPPLLTALLEVFQRPQDILWSQHLTAAARSARRSFTRAGFTIICLPHEAFFSMDAILRTIWRLTVTHKRLLEWTPSDNSRGSHAGFVGSLKSMWIGPVIAIMSAITLSVIHPVALISAAPVLSLWLFSPAVVWGIGRPLTAHRTKLTPDQTIFLRKVARKTWAFFETFVGPGDHWLPPDNYQESPTAAIAHRTSPTNMGLALLANLSAYDFGYIGAEQLIERTTQTLDTMAGMERYHGHFYNWYDTQSLKPLAPLYVSTVDSGNLAGHLLTLRAGLLSLADHKILGARIFEGIEDTVAVMTDLKGETTFSFPVELRTSLKSAPTAVANTRHDLERIATWADETTRNLAAGPEAEAGDLTRALSRQCRSALNELNSLAQADGEIPTLRGLASGSATRSSEIARKRISAIDSLAKRCDELAHMEYGFLFDKTRQLLAIGYNVDSARRDDSYYDLLASEARLCSFVAIAQGQLPQETWFALGRLLAGVGGEPILISWSGSMFEYLMPLLIMPTYENTLLDQTYKTAVARQIEYGKMRGVPWGISESGYHAIDVHLNYQYRAFGVPGLGLKRGLAEDLVIAPYATAMALMVAPEEACLNLQRLSQEGREGKYGFYESMDYTPSRLPRGESCAVVRSFMAHHQGMTLLSLAYALLDRPMQRRFEADPQFQATTLLLQERIPRATAFHSQAAEFSDMRTTALVPETPVRMFTDPNTSTPEVQLLSNGRYHVMVTNAGGGYSRWKDLAVTRWREDTTRDHWGAFCYLRDVASGEYWSTAHQPTLKQPDSYEAIFSDSRVEFRRRDYGYDAHTEIAVSPEDDIELRRVTITNRALRTRTIEVTSYAEVVLAPPIADALHPAFSNLFVQTEILPQRQAILCTRRPRSIDEPVPWMFQVMTVHGGGNSEVSYETDRVQFIGRGNTAQDPQAMKTPGSLSNGEGSVLDPIMAIRVRLTLAAGESAIINIVSGVGETRDTCLGLLEKYQDRRLADRVFDLAWTHSQVALRQLNASEADAQLYERLAGSVLYANSSLRANASTLLQNRRGQSGLWGQAISGDLPIVLLQIADPANIDLVRQVVQAHGYWRLKGLAVDLVIWNEDQAGYRQQLQEQIMGLIAAGIEANITDRPGGIFVRPAERMSNEDRILFQTVARVILTDKNGTLEDQIKNSQLGASTREAAAPKLIPVRTRNAAALSRNEESPRRDLLFFNGLGGFTADGREYVITLSEAQTTPAPWVNVLANPSFGTVVSESGLAYTWGENAHEFRLTPWANDPVSDSNGEAFYLRDEESGDYWSPAPQPSRGKGNYTSRHGFGYSVFEHTEGGISSELWIYAAIDAAIKFSIVKIRNNSAKPRKLSTTGYTEWVLGDLRPKTAMHVVTEVDCSTGALFARNPYSTEFGERVAFFSVSALNRTVTGSRAEFIGRNGGLSNPAAMARTRLSGIVGAGLDPCAAIQVSFDLGPGEEREIVFVLGIGRDAEDARKLVRRFPGPAAAREALDAVWQYWNHTLGAVNIETPDPSVNVLANGWLLYQTLACRLWGRSGFYQSGGAFGFRDQLQDVMALVHAQPQLIRDHLLLCARHQFLEGDVQHWWHPPLSRGVRTRCSDDFLWLALATCRYVSNTGDSEILDERLPFLEGRQVSPEEDSYYDLPGQSEETATLYEHCVRAILRGLRLGQHGLPLMLSGDWNDGMNLVGNAGKGESVWLAFFLCDVLTQFSELARLRGDTVFRDRCFEEVVRLKRNIEESGWDGEWYRRAYFDDGSPLGSETNPECKIDSIPQSWSVLSGAGNAAHSHLAMEAVDSHLVRRDHRLIQLLDPPFDQSALNPGYIKGYVPGVRENGGQYTHAAIWTTMAFAALGDNRRAWELFAMINPISHSSSPDEIAKYKVEPYVAAADIYAVPPHTGRGGWTWYTGSAGWMYRLILESLLGLRLEGSCLHFNPCIPADWNGFKIHYRYRETVHHISVLRNSAGINGGSVTVDGVVQQDMAIPLVDDSREHTVEVRW
jgi:cyclic beta-1,2-glucan synthetase